MSSHAIVCYIQNLIPSQINSLNGAIYKILHKRPFYQNRAFLHSIQPVLIKLFACRQISDIIKIYHVNCGCRSKRKVFRIDGKTKDIMAFFKNLVIQFCKHCWLVPCTIILSTALQCDFCRVKISYNPIISGRVSCLVFPTAQILVRQALIIFTK